METIKRGFHLMDGLVFVNSCILTAGSNTDATGEPLQALQFCQQQHRGRTRGDGGRLSDPFIQPVLETGCSLHLCTSKVLSVFWLAGS